MYCTNIMISFCMLGYFAFTKLISTFCFLILCIISPISGWDPDHILHMCIDLCYNLQNTMVNDMFFHSSVELLFMGSTSALARARIDTLESLGLMSSPMPKSDLSYPSISSMQIHGSHLVRRSLVHSFLPLQAIVILLAQ